MKNKILNLLLVLVLLVGMVPIVYAPSHPINNDETNIRACYKNCDSILRQKDVESRNRMRYKECMSKCDGPSDNSGFCIQVITPAMNPETKECKEFSTPCDVPKGWKKVGNCGSSEDSQVGFLDRDVVNAIDPATGKCWAFKNSFEAPSGWKILKVIGKAPNCEWWKSKNEMKELKEKRKEMMKDQKDRIKTIKDEKSKIKGNAGDFVKDCKTQGTNECKEKFKGLKSSLGNYYVNVLEMLEKQLNIIKESGIDVSKQVDSINALKTRVSAINEQTTKEELRKLHSDIKALTKEIKEFHQKSKRMMTLSKFGGVLEKAEKLEKKLDNILENAKKGNKDTSNLNSLIDSFKEHVAKAKEYQDGMMKRADGMMKDMTELMRKAHAELKEAHAVLIKIHQELKEKKIIGGGEA